MRILVTRGAGFIGSHVVDAYVEAGHDVWALDDLSQGRRGLVNPEATFLELDFGSPDLRGVLAAHHFDCISHHVDPVGVSAADPIRETMSNVVGTLHLLEAARANGKPRIVFSSTGGAVYGAQRCFPATEDHPTIPLSPYGVATRTVEHYLEHYRHAHGLRHLALRYANVYGPRQDPDRDGGVIAVFCQRVLQDRAFMIHGDGEQTRDYVHVRDVARANLLAMECLTTSMITDGNGRAALGRRACGASGPPERPQSLDAAKTAPIFNIGTGIETSVNALTAMLLDAAAADCRIGYQPPRPGDRRRSCIDPGRARDYLGWLPLTPLEEGLAETFAWFRRQEESKSHALAGVGRAAGSRQLAAGSSAGSWQQAAGSGRETEGSR
jgi:UDP-glucose 4-epimerase